MKYFVCTLLSILAKDTNAEGIFEDGVIQVLEAEESPSILSTDGVNHLEEVAISLEAANEEPEPKALNGTIDFTIYEFKKDDPNFEVLCKSPPDKREQKRYIYDKEDADKFFIKWE